ncbi:MAG: GAF domain-containing sensor histidine kinase [Thermoflexales bacterium]|nr:GAF domain-containing sensor histidine kinase [Thermoflexales bacterium]
MGRPSLNLEERIARLQRIIELSRLLNSTLSLRPLLSEIVRAVCDLTDAETGSILLVDRRTGELRFEATTHPDGHAIYQMAVPMESIAGWVFQHNEPVIVPNAREDPRFYAQVDRETGVETRSLIAVPMAVRGKVIGVLEVINRRNGAPFTDDDLETLRILADQAAIAVENAVLFEQSDLVAEIVHEMRTPLGVIAAYADLITRETTSPQDRDEFARLIQQEALRLSQMAGEFLDLARLESGRVFLAREPVDLTEVVESVLAALRPQAEKKQIYLEAAIAPNLPTIPGDPGRIRQALLNLVANAVKYCRPGDRVTVRADPGDGEVQLSVIDTGPGIPRELQERLFEKFVRLPIGEQWAEGSGLGLAICRRIVETHGGRIWVESEEGQGAAFYFTLPIGHD